jgi:hypothetical protein
MFKNTPTKVDTCVCTEEWQTCDGITSTVDQTLVCAAYTQRDQVCYDYQSINEDYKLGILKCWYLQPVFVFPLRCSQNVEVTITMCAVHMQVFRRSLVSFYKVLEYVTAHTEF